jgi:hypothetical protein
MKRMLVLATVLGFMALTMWAQDVHASPVDQLYNRLENQQRRIDEGIARRQLDRREADSAQDSLNRIRATFDRMRRDGRLTPPEIRRLNSMLDDNSRMIAVERHDRDSRPGPRGDFRERIEDQQRRINEGIARRQLTRHEADAVQDNLNWIRATNDRMKRDGRLSWKEATRLDEMLDRNSRLINKERTDVDYDNRFRSRFGAGF